MAEERISEMREKLYLKNIKGQDYFYLREKTPFFSKEYYVCKYTINEEEISSALKLTRTKIMVDMLYTLFHQWKSSFKAQYISDGDFLALELLRFGYNFGLKEFDNTDIKKYEDVIYTKYVYGTTNIEGNTYTLRETGLTLNEGLTVEGKQKREFYEIENYANLKKYLDAKKNTEVTLDLIKEIHKIIMTNIDTDSAGEFRKVQAGITGTDFMPVPSILIEESLGKLLTWYNNEKEKTYPIELISIFHQKFEEIHPFSDGNGRVGREVIRIMLRNIGFPSIFIGPKDREQYLKSLDSGNKNNYEPIVKFIVKNLQSVHDTLFERASETLAITKDNSSIGEKQKRIIDKFIEKLNAIKLKKEEGMYDFKN